MLPPDHYTRAALDAEFHVQVEIDRVVLPSEVTGVAVVEGRVARVFRGDPALLTSNISLEVSCIREGALPPPSGVRWLITEKLERAAAIEAYLNRDGYGGYAVARWNSFLIDAVTDTPARPITEADLVFR
ncbi:hypothetical protein COCOR_03184 [Corallococcus coralloides DSM 2259]|uniref:Uncharacterized protein n=1 Tax=Corallococcus coralloides (strain ATCC 25202 / DSM 2259 / NBRC 100086 / M2) TaxID=1144275 RepID=H8MF80_CORCM|nr:hypothetical protein [Corallococcus coralloides]AFE05067.1 hypothetical protein COCOR_03184 [Corallococcus coralloides DSM 2259]